MKSKLTKLPLHLTVYEVLKDTGLLTYGSEIPNKTIEDVVNMKRDKDNPKWCFMMIALTKKIKTEHGLLLRTRGMRQKGYRLLRQEEVTIVQHEKLKTHRRENIEGVRCMSMINTAVLSPEDREMHTQTIQRQAVVALFIDKTLRRPALPSPHQEDALRKVLSKCA